MVKFGEYWVSDDAPKEGDRVICIQDTSVNFGKIEAVNKILAKHNLVDTKNWKVIVDSNDNDKVLKFTATKTFDLEVIGDIAFVFNKQSRRKGKRILVSDVTIYDKSRMSIDADTEKMLMREMKAKGSDLLTDGIRFYTTVGGAIQEIAHPQFQKELDLHKELYK